ncbi:hypothetical protein HN832_01340 [archaeon]|jgi:DNA polymerase II small subunit|nr:hypothetical protein [archaeon]MBT4373049.1 hypothetical protein [archaeon]MBT4531394.1 hypothetical protein [archaeon]MBT7282035.1 hypothetical protein [archaeon]
MNEIVQFCLEKGLLLDKELLNLFSENSDLESIKLIINKFKHFTNKRVITKNIFTENKDSINNLLSGLSQENQKKLEKLKIKLGLTIKISREENFVAEPVNNNLIEKKVFEENNGIREEKLKNEIITKINNFDDVKIIGNYPALSKKLEVKDFVTYFKNRFSTLKNILQEHSELDKLVSIGKMSGNRQIISIIGIVSNKRITKNKNILLEVEDLTGKLKVLINKDKKELYKKAEEIPLDSVIGFKGAGNKEILFVNEIIFPESRLAFRKKGIVDENVLFIGDIHVGSKFFMEDNFLKFINYLNGNVPGTEDEIKKIKYLFILGDLVAGVGIHPGQERELTIANVEDQYIHAAKLLNKIRKDIKIIISPGNHDAVRIMEPQPILDEKYAWSLYEIKNVLLIGNPSIINIGAKEGFSGFNILNYHGYSYHYYSGNISRLIVEKAVHKPEIIMEYLLKFRHLAPTHSSTLYFPSEEDPFIIRDIPDIFVSGHTHKSAVSYYNNVLIVSSSSWESLTPFQEKMGNEPDFCKVPLFNLKTRAVKILDFE